jgi:uncharacterized protein YbjT (DUF2867 family)
MDHGGRMQVVTGAFGYSGRSIASRLLERGERVRTLTSSTNRENPFGGQVEAVPFSFDEPRALRQALEGAEVLYNTYWVRFDHRDFSQSSAVANTRALFEAARAAGVRRVVHVSITNPSPDSPLPYFRGKAMLEESLLGTGLSHAILRPAGSSARGRTPQQRRLGPPPLPLLHGLRKGPLPPPVDPRRRSRDAGRRAGRSGTERDDHELRPALVATYGP